MAPRRDELQKSRSCGDLPDMSLRNNISEQSNAGCFDGKNTDETDATFTEDTVTPISSKDCSDDGDSNSTTSASGSFTEAGLLLHLAPDADLQHDDAATPSLSGSRVTPAMRRRLRRRRAAVEKDKNEIIEPEDLNGDSKPALAEARRWQPSSNGSSSPASTSAGDSRSSRASSGFSGDFCSFLRQQKEEEEGREVLLQQLWAGGSSNAEDILQATYGFIDNLSLLNIVDTVHAIGKCAESEHQALALGTDKRLLALIWRLRQRAQGLQKGRVISRAIWGLGKVGAAGEDVAHLLTKLSETTTANPALLEGCSSQELSNTLWGLARLGSSDSRCRCHAERLALRIVAVSGKRLRELTPQCLANSLWAIGKLGIRGQSVAAFADHCLQEMCYRRQLTGFSAQGLANSLWACARLQLQAEVVPVFCCAVARQVGDERLKEFLPQELSMTIWAFAKITGRGSRGSGSANRHHRRQRALLDVETFVLAATKEAASRINEFSPQGLSNIGWALATMELTREECVYSFLVATAAKAMPELNSYPPQAIANLCWAMCRVNDASGDLAVHFFASAVAVQAEQRMEEFEWQDLAGIVSAMNRAELVHLPQVHSFATALIWYATEGSCSEIGTQALLNMALSAARLGVEPDVLLPLAERIDAIFAAEGSAESLNDIDRRQWSQVKLHCCSSHPCWYEESEYGSSWSEAAMLVRGHSKFDSAFLQRGGYGGQSPYADAVPEAVPVNVLQVWMPSEVWS